MAGPQLAFPSPSLSQPNQIGFINMLVVTSTQNWVVPAGVTAAKVTVVGAGGAGGGCNNSTGAMRGGGGRSGGVAIKYITGLTPGSTVACTIGAGGTGVVNGSGNSGGTTSFGAYCSATGGGGGSANINVNTYTASVSGGSGASGDINITGLATDDIAVGVGLTATCGGVITGAYLYYGGMRGAHGWNSLGFGGALKTTTGAANNATGYNAGGGGAFSAGANLAGGTGASGLIIIEY